MMSGRLRTVQTSASLSQQVYDSLRTAISSGELKPGAQITERGLAEEMGVSPTPVREALRRLEQERLVYRGPTKTLRVSRVSVEMLRQLGYARAGIRGLLARFATPNLTSEDHAWLQHNVDVAHRRLSDGDIINVVHETQDFHAYIDARAGNDVLESVSNTLEVFGDRLRHSVAQAVTKESQRRNPYEEHQEILDAIIDGDALEVERLTRLHVEAAVDDLIMMYELTVTTTAGNPADAEYPTPIPLMGTA